MIHHGGYFAAAGIGVQSFRTGRTPDAPGYFGRSATNAVYVVPIMRLLSRHYAVMCNSG